MASPQQSRIQSYLESNKIGPLFEELMTKLISETPDRPIPFLIDHLQSKQDSPGKMHRALSGSAALWAQTSPEIKNSRRELHQHDKPWQFHSKKPKKSKSDLAVSSLSPPSPEHKSLPQCPSWDWRDGRDLDELNHILLESKKLGRALESLSRSMTNPDDVDQNLGGFNPVLRPRVVGEWSGRTEEDADPLAAEMMTVPPGKSHVGWSGDGLPLASFKLEAKSMKGLKEQQQHHRDLLAAMLAQDSVGPLRGPAPFEDETDYDDDDDATELLEDLDDLRMEGVNALAPSGCKFSRGRGSYQSEPQAKVTLNICSRCARLQGDSLSSGPPQETPRPPRPPMSERAVPDISSSSPGVDALTTTTAAAAAAAAAARRLQECEAPSRVSTNARQSVWDADVKAWRAGGLLLGDPLFSKELESMGKQLAEVEKDLAKLAEAGKSHARNNPAGGSLMRSLPDTLPLAGFPYGARSASGGFSGKAGAAFPPPASPGSASPRPTARARAFSNPGSRTHTPGTPNSLRSGFYGHKEAAGGFRRSRSRPVTPTGRPAYTRRLLTPPGLSTTDSLGASLRAYLSEDEFYQRLQAIRQPWHLPGDLDGGDMAEPPEQDKSAGRRSLFSGL